MAGMGGAEAVTAPGAERQRQAWMNDEDWIPGTGRSLDESAYGIDTGSQNGTIGDTALAAHGAPGAGDSADADGADDGLGGMPRAGGAVGQDGEYERQAWMNGDSDIWGTSSGGTSSVLGDS
jgi:hypothetical protein